MRGREGARRNGPAQDTVRGPRGSFVVVVTVIDSVVVVVRGPKGEGAREQLSRELVLASERLNRFPPSEFEFLPLDRPGPHY